MMSLVRFKHRANDLRDRVHVFIVRGEEGNRLNVVLLLLNS